MNIEQRILHNLMMMPVNKTPPFPANKTAIEVGEKIKALFDNGTFTKMILDEECRVHCL
jgi:hypothetical protein